VFDRDRRVCGRSGRRRPERRLVAIGLWMLLGVLIGFALFYLAAWFYG
jgi:hypothetical protein